MKNKSKNISILLLTLTTVFFGAALLSAPVFAVDATKDVTVNVLEACTFAAETYTTTVPTVPGTTSNTEDPSVKPASAVIETTCNGLNGWKVQAVGYSPDSTHATGNDGNTSMYSPVTGGTGNFIPTGTSGTGSYWSFKISSASSSTTASILNGYGTYSDIPSTPVNVVNYTGDGLATSITGTMRTDYQIHVNNAQAPGTYTGKVKYTIAVNP